MKRYVDGYVLPISKAKMKTYKKMASDAGKVWLKHGALQYSECVAEDMESAEKWGCLPFPKMINAKRNEVVIFAFVVYKSRAHRDRVNKKVRQEFDEIYKDKKDMPMPFDMKRMAVGGFETIVNY